MNIQRFSFFWTCLPALVLFLPLPAAGQPKADSLLKAANAVYDRDPGKGISLARLSYQRARAGKEQLAQLKSLVVLSGFYYRQRKADSARFYGEYCLAEATRFKTDSLRGDAWMILGMTDFADGDYRHAAEKYRRAIDFYQVPQSRLELAIAGYNLGICEKKQSNYAAAVNYYLTASNLFERLKRDDYLNFTYNSLSLCFVSLSDYPKAVLYGKRTLLIRRKMKNDHLIAQSLNNIGFAFKEGQQPDSAVTYLTQSISLYQKEKDSSTLVLPLQNLGSAYQMKGNTGRALRYIKRSLTIASAYAMQEETARGDLDLAGLYTAIKQYGLARQAILVTEQTAIRLKLPELLMQAYAAWFKWYQQQGDYKTALAYEQKKERLGDSLFSTAKAKAVQQLEIQYQVKEKEKDIASLNIQNTLKDKLLSQQRALIVVLIIAAILLVLSLFAAFNNYRNKSRASKRIQLLMTDLHHRVKNNLQILSGLFTMQIESLSDEYTKNALRENESRLISMNLIHSKLYRDQVTTKIEMNAYLTELLHHVKQTFGSQEVRLSTAVDQISLEADKAVAIGLIINELSTNAFKYAFTEDQKGAEIRLSLSLQGRSKILLSLGDNGKGIAGVRKEKGGAFGLKLVNLMAGQLRTAVTVKNEGGLSYTLEIDV